MGKAAVAWAWMLWLVTSSVQAQTCTVEEPIAPDNLFPSVRITTSLGEVVVELDRRRAPITVNNFLQYVQAKTYDGTLFHRVVPGFVVQGGGYDSEFNERGEFEPIYNESGNGLANNVQTIAMARYNDPHTATNQFFFNLNDNDSLNPNRRSWGYAVFGYVTEGWDVVEKIAAVETAFSTQLDAADVPVEAVMIESVTLIEGP